MAGVKYHPPHLKLRSVSLAVSLVMLGATALSCTGEQGQTAAALSRGPSFGACRLVHTETIESGSFPRFVIRRTYDSSSGSSGLLGDGWSCWPLDVCLAHKDMDGLAVIALQHMGGLEDLFVIVEEGLFAPLDPERLETVSLQKAATGYVLVDLLTGQMDFDDAGRVTSLSDTHGNALTITRDEGGLPTGVTVYMPEKVSFEIVCNQETRRLNSVSAPDGRTWRYAYDEDGLLATVTDDHGFTTTYKYEEGRIVETADSLENRTAYRYDRKGRLAEIDHNGRKELRRYTALSSSPDDWMVTITDPIGRETEFRFLTSERREVIREKDGNVIVRQYDENWQLQHISSQKDGVTSFARDELGRPTGILDPLNHLTTVRYDNALGLPSAIIDDFGHVQEFKYTSRGKVREARSSDGQEMSVRYNRFGQPLSVTASSAGTTRFQYGKNGTLERINSDVYGQLEAPNSRPSPNLAAFLWPPAFAVLPLPVQRLELSAALSDCSLVNEDIAQRSRTLFTKNQTPWRCAYDRFGNLAEIQEREHTVASFKYDAIDRLIEARYSESEVETFEYDAGDRVVRYVDPEGNVYQYEYDLRGNILKETLPDREEHIFEYDEAGQLISAFDSFWHDIFAYDSLGRVVRVGRLTPMSEGPETLVSYTYNDDSRLESALIWGGPRCTYEYNETSTIETLRFLNTKLVVNYDEAGRCSSVYFPAGMKLEYGYTRDGAISRIRLENAQGEAMITQFCEYQDDSLGKVTSKAPQRNGEYSFEHTPEGLLRSTTLNNEHIERPNGDKPIESFDALGRLRLTGDGGKLTEYIYGTAGLASVITRESAIYLVRSSDGVPRAVLVGGHVGYLVPSALPDEAFFIDQDTMTIRPIPFRDSSRPFIRLEQGDAS